MYRPGELDGPCGGPSRRALLQAGLTSVVGLGLSDLFRLQARASGPGGVKPTKVKSCILIWLAGGASHIDTFDPKPDASADIRGEFKPIDTVVPGLKISEILPKMAKVMDKVTLIRSVTSPEAEHARALASHAHRLPAEPGGGLPERRQRRRAGRLGRPRGPAAVRRRARRARSSARADT